MIDRYLVDTVTLSRMTLEQRATEFMLRFCRIPEEILFEAQGLPDIEALKQLVYPTTVAVLGNVRHVMSTMRPDDKVVDLYTNKGNGDVLLLATALTEKAVGEMQLIADRWVIDTSDAGLTNKALDLGVPTCSSEHFIGLVAEPGR